MAFKPILRGKRLNTRVPEQAEQRLQTLLRCVYANLEPLLVFSRCVCLVTSLYCDAKTLGHLTGCAALDTNRWWGRHFVTYIQQPTFKMSLRPCLILVCKTCAASVVPLLSACVEAKKCSQGSTLASHSYDYTLIMTYPICG
jgi:hypothetical protein